jgi:hypothetical protein
VARTFSRASFHHLVGVPQERLRNSEAKRFRRAAYPQIPRFQKS